MDIVEKKIRKANTVLVEMLVSSGSGSVSKLGFISCVCVCVLSKKRSIKAVTISGLSSLNEVMFSTMH